MRALIAFDKFKDALTAEEACAVSAEALQEQHPSWELDLCPLSDGGEGFADTLARCTDAEAVTLEVEGPRGGAVKATYFLVLATSIPRRCREQLLSGVEHAHNARLALIDMASASGLALLAPEFRNPWQTSTVGTGQLIRAAAERGAAAIVLGVGGSATQDLGLGALSALGFEFDTPAGTPLRPPVPGGWERLARIHGGLSRAIPPLIVACDVTNPLLGSFGSARTYAVQKGLPPSDMDELETRATRVAQSLCAACGHPASLANEPRTGAAGGLAFGLACGARARLVDGFGMVSDWLDLPGRIENADVVITGEGCFDRTSFSGKAAGSLIRQAFAVGKTIHVFAGQIAPGVETLSERLQLHAITPPHTSPPVALRETRTNLACALRRLVS